MGRLVDLTGLKFNRLKVIHRNGVSKNGRVKWLCQCDCGNKVTVLGERLRTEKTKSCGCLMIELVTTHGHCSNGSSSAEYVSWQGMINRCYYPGLGSYKHYGGRGITVVDRWLTFGNFLEDMGKKPNKSYSLDRIDNIKGYAPDNCRWTNQTNQLRNQRISSKNTTGVRGVSWSKQKSKYIAYINVKKKRVHLGFFTNLEEAKKARRIAEENYWNKSS